MHRLGHGVNRKNPTRKMSKNLFLGRHLSSTTRRRLDVAPGLKGETLSRGLRPLGRRKWMPLSRSLQAV
jgi:hypothetical protein